MRNLFILIICIFLSVSLAFAATDVQKYEVRLVKLELYENTRGWVTVFEGDANNLSSPLDIASAASGQTVGTFMSALTVPDGTYTKARATPYVTFTIRGIVNSGGTDYYTTSATTVTEGRTASVATTTVGTPQDCTVTVLTADMNQSSSAGVTFTGGPVVATNNIPNKKIKVFFDMSNALTAVNTGPASGIVYPGPPTVTMTAE